MYIVWFRPSHLYHHLSINSLVFFFFVLKFFLTRTPLDRFVGQKIMGPSIKLVFVRPILDPRGYLWWNRYTCLTGRFIVLYPFVICGFLLPPPHSPRFCWSWKNPGILGISEHEFYILMAFEHRNEDLNSLDSEEDLEKMESEVEQMSRKVSEYRKSLPSNLSNSVISSRRSNFPNIDSLGFRTTSTVWKNL